MNDVGRPDPQARRMYFLVCANFSMLFILFCGLGLVLWQSLSLVSDLRRDLERAEQSVMEMRERMQALDSEEVLQQAIATAVEGAVAEMADAIPNAQELAEIPAKVDATTDAIQLIAGKVDSLDTEALASQVAYEILKGLGDGFSEAAESRQR